MSEILGAAVWLTFGMVGAAFIILGGLEDHVKPYLQRIADALEKIAESRKA